MTNPDLIPLLDPNPLPAPYWIFKVLLLVTFLLHLVAMNFMLGGAFLTLALRRSSGATGPRLAIAQDLAKKLPLLLPATITLGVAPLLFVQVLYGQFFYTSSIIMAWPWLLVLAILTVAYYGFYFVSYQGGRRPGIASVVLWLSTALLVLIGFLYSNNLTLLETPTRWAGKYFASAAGWHLNLSEPTLYARFLHFFTAAVAMGGLLLVGFAHLKSRQNAEYARVALHYGGRTFVYATLAQFVVGVWFLIALPRELRMLYLGDNVVATTLFLAGVAAAIGALVFVVEAVRRNDTRMATWYGLGLTSVAIGCMVVMRDLLRDAYLKPYFSPDQFAVQTQWSVLPLFLILFIAGVALFVWMARRYVLLTRGTPSTSNLRPEKGAQS